MLRPMGINSSLRAWAKRIKHDGVTLWFAGKNPGTPWYAKALGLFVVTYALSPIDLVPDFIPVLGYVDDVLLLPGLIWLTIKLLPVKVLAEPCPSGCMDGIQGRQTNQQDRRRPHRVALAAGLLGRLNWWTVWRTA